MIEPRIKLRRNGIRNAMDYCSESLSELLSLDQWQVDYRLKRGFTEDEVQTIEQATGFDREEFVL